MSNIKWEAFGNEAIGRVGGKIKYVCCQSPSKSKIYKGFQLGDDLKLQDMDLFGSTFGVAMAKVENHHDNQVNKEKKSTSPVLPISID